MSEIMNKGYCMLSKELMDSEYYFSERFTHMQAYIDLCLLAEWKDRKFIKRGQVVELKAGQLAKSEEELAARWKWSRNTVRKYLNEQQTIGNIEQQKSRLITIITVKFGLNVAQQIEQQNTVKTEQQIEQQLEDIYIDNINIKEEGSIEPKKKKQYSDEFDSDWDLYGRKGSKKNSYEQWKKLTDEDKEKMRRHIPHYLQSNDRQYLKDFERYIKHRVFESPVYRQSNMLFDPQMVENHQNGEYDPSEWLNYDENFDAFRYFGREPKYDLRDGYTDDNRPDGARVVTQATVYVWSASSKKWSVTK